MKKFGLLLVFLCISYFTIAQKVTTSQVPPAVKVTLMSKLNDTTVQQWEKDGEVYKAIINKGEMIANVFINLNGVWKSTIWYLPYQYVPKKIAEYVKANHPKAKSKAITSSLQFRADGDFYVIEIKQKKKVDVLTFTLKGEFKPAEPKN